MNSTTKARERPKAGRKPGLGARVRAFGAKHWRNRELYGLLENGEIERVAALLIRHPENARHVGRLLFDESYGWSSDPHGFNALAAMAMAARDGADLSAAADAMVNCIGYERDPRTAANGVCVEGDVYGLQVAAGKVGNCGERICKALLSRIALRGGTNEIRQLGKVGNQGEVSRGTINRLWGMLLPGPRLVCGYSSQQRSDAVWALTEIGKNEANRAKVLDVVGDWMGDSIRCKENAVLVFERLFEGGVDISEAAPGLAKEAGLDRGLGSKGLVAAIANIQAGHLNDGLNGRITGLLRKHAERAESA